MSRPPASPVGGWRHGQRFVAWAYDSGSDTAPKEVFVHHAAGIDGLGGSSYIDDVILREADELDGSGNPAWAAAVGGAGAREDRLFYLQNWRADVVVTVRKPASTGATPAAVDHVRYSAYGVPWATSLADVGAIGQTAYLFAPDGQITYDDSSLFSNAFSDNDLLADVTGIGGGADQLTPPDGQLTVDDVIAFYNAYADDGGVTGRGVLSRTHSRRGYAGYEFDPGLELASRGLTFNGAATLVPSRSMWHVRNRVLDSETGRWTRRDPALGIAAERACWA